MSTKIHRTNIPSHALPKFGAGVAEVVVSTVRCEGRYETAIIVRAAGGRSLVLEPAVARKKAEADLEDDEAVAFCMGYRDASSRRAARWAELVCAAVEGGAP